MYLLGPGMIDCKVTSSTMDRDSKVPTSIRYNRW